MPPRPANSHAALTSNAHKWHMVPRIRRPLIQDLDRLAAQAHELALEGKVGNSRLLGAEIVFNK